MIAAGRTVATQFTRSARMFPGAVAALDFVRRRYIVNGVRAYDIRNLPGVTFTRAATAYARGRDGIYYPFGSGIPRITDRGLFIQSAVTNNALYSRDFTNAVWTASNMTAAVNAVGVDGAANSASTLTATAGNATIMQAFVLGSATRNYVVWLRRVSGTGNIDLTRDGGTGWTTQTITSQWQPYTISNFNSANPTIGIRIVTSGDVIEADSAILESNNSAAHPGQNPIFTTSATVTQAADVFNFSLPGYRSYTMVFWGSGDLASAGEVEVMEVRGATTADRSLGIRGASTSGCYVYSSSALQASPGGVGSYTLGGAPYRIAVSVQTDSMNVACQGTAGTRDTTATLPATDSVAVHLGKTSPADGTPNMFIERVAVYPTDKTNSELIGLTKTNPTGWQ